MIFFTIGLCMGTLGGMLGIGGSVIMIPALTIVYGENQHLYQAAAMICNFFVAAASLIAHRKAEVLNKAVLKWMVPMAMLCVLGGVALSNCSLFGGRQSYFLTRLFGAFLVYVVGYNSYRFYQSLTRKSSIPKTRDFIPAARRGILAGFCGAAAGTVAGLLGTGAGTVAIPMQQFFLRSPMREAMGNSAAVIVCIAWLGAIYKNVTLPIHGLAISESLKIAGCVIPGAVLGGFIGGHLMHILPKNLVRAVFILVCALAAIKMLTVSPG